MESVQKFDDKCKQDIREEFNLHTQLQGPQGCVSSVYSSNVAKHVKILQALRDTYPEIKSEIKTSAIGTKPNESTFSLVRGEQLTPDAFEFGRIYPKLVRETVLQSSVDPEFLYVTRQHKPKHYEQATGFHNIDVPSLPRIPKAAPLPAADLLILRDYKAKYLQGVRQNSIRNTNTKRKAGTLPLYAYQSENPEASPLNFNDMLTNDFLESSSQNAVIYKSGSIFLINSPGVTADVVLGELLKNVCQGETYATVRIHHNDIDNPLVLISSSRKDVMLSDIIKVIVLDSLDTLSETEYLRILDKEDSISAVPTDNENNEAAEESEVISLAAFLGTDTTSKRVRRVPRRLVDDYQLE